MDHGDGEGGAAAGLPGGADLSDLSDLSDLPGPGAFLCGRAAAMSVFQTCLINRKTLGTCSMPLGSFVLFESGQGDFR